MQRRNEYLTGILVLSLVLFVYVKGVSPSVFAGDSGDIILSSWFASIAHAPGYPFQSLLGWLFTHLVPFQNVAYKANLFAGVIQGLTVMLLYFVLLKITKNLLASVAASLFLGFTYLFWLYAHVIEVFQLNVLLVTFCVYFLMVWRASFYKKKTEEKFLYFAMFFLGLSNFHHQTSMLIIPAVIYLVYKTNKKMFRRIANLAKLGICYFLGALPLLYLPIASRMALPTNWGDASTIEGFVRLVSRSEYGTFVAAGSLYGINLTSRVSEIGYFLLSVKADFRILGIAMSGLGLIYLFRKDRTLFWFLIYCIFFTGPFFLFYSSFPFWNEFYQGLLERFLLLNYFFLGICVAYGFLLYLDVLSFVRKKFKIPVKLSRYYALLALLILVLPLQLLFENFSKTDMADFKLGDWLGEDLLKSSEVNSIIFLLGDTQTFNTEYVYYTKSEYGRSRKIVRGGSLSDVYYRAKLQKLYPDLTYPPDFLDERKSDGEYFVRSLITQNFDKFPIYFNSDPIDIENYKWTNSGLLKKLVRDNQYEKNSLAEENIRIFDTLGYSDFNYNFGYTSFMTTHIKGIYYESLRRLSVELLNLNQNEDAVYFLQKAREILPEQKEAYVLLGNLYLTEKKCKDARLNYEMIYSLDNEDWQSLEALSKVYGDCEGNQPLADKYFQKATDVKAREKKDKKNLELPQL